MAKLQWSVRWPNAIEAPCGRRNVIFPAFYSVYAAGWRGDGIWDWGAPSQKGGPVERDTGGQMFVIGTAASRGFDEDSGGGGVGERTHEVK